MFLPSIVLPGLIALAAQGAPLTKRIAQTISASTAKWEQACLAAGGAQQCNPISVEAFTTLLAAAGPCEQQNAADKMIDLAKSLNNDAKMIQLAQIFAQQPRNTPTSQSVPYCQQAPKNQELSGLFQCQFAGANPKVFVGGITVGQQGTIPLGFNAPLSPPGSCPAHPDGPIPDGTQLVDVTQNPGSASGGQQGGNTAPPSAPQQDPSSSTSSTTAAGGNAPSPTASESVPTPDPTTVAGDFKLQNGKDAQKLNANFATLSADAACTSGDQACIGDSFAQCVNGKFATTSCGASLTCAALPLVNKPGTSIACTTKADAAARIAATGATGGITGSDISSSPSPSGSPGQSNVVKSDSQTNSGSAPAAPVNTPATGGDFRAQNGRDAQALNAKFKDLSATSSCTDGEQACIGTGFAQCVNGKFVVTQCGATLTCAALPLVNKAGTSITCTTEADAVARIQASGATGGLTGA